MSNVVDKKHNYLQKFKSLDLASYICSEYKKNS